MGSVSIKEICRTAIWAYLHRFARLTELELLMYPNVMLTESKTLFLSDGDFKDQTQLHNNEDSLSNLNYMQTHRQNNEFSYI